MIAGVLMAAVCVFAWVLAVDAVSALWAALAGHYWFKIALGGLAACVVLMIYEAVTQ
jgi:hypothetical protein